MSDIRIVLRLERRSGILAAAIASLRRSGLQFKSQRRTEGDDGPLLVLGAGGDIADPAKLAATLSATRGIEDIVELKIDGRDALAGEHANGKAVPSPPLEPVEPPTPEPTPAAVSPAPVASRERPSNLTASIAIRTADSARRRRRQRSRI